MNIEMNVNENNTTYIFVQSKIKTMVIRSPGGVNLPVIKATMRSVFALKDEREVIHGVAALLNNKHVVSTLEGKLAGQFDDGAEALADIVLSAILSGQESATKILIANINLTHAAPIIVYSTISRTSSTTSDLLKLLALGVPVNKQRKSTSHFPNDSTFLLIKKAELALDWQHSEFWDAMIGAGCDVNAYKVTATGGWGNLAYYLAVAMGRNIDLAGVNIKRCEPIITVAKHLISRGMDRARKDGLTANVEGAPAKNLLACLRNRTRLQETRGRALLELVRINMSELLAAACHPADVKAIHLIHGPEALIELTANPPAASAKNQRAVRTAAIDLLSDGPG